jgi:hypothetical protein
MKPARRLNAPHPAPAFPRILRTTVAQWVAALQAEGAVRRATALQEGGLAPLSVCGATGPRRGAPSAALVA